MLSYKPLSLRLLSPSTSPVQLGTIPRQRGNSVVVLATLLVIVLPLLLLALLVALLGLEFLLPQLVCGVFVQIGEDQGEDLRVPLYRVAGDAFFDVLRRVSILLSSL